MDGLQVVVPSKFQKQLFNSVHTPVHFGGKRTASQLRERFYFDWVGIHKDVSAMCIPSVCEKKRKETTRESTTTVLPEWCPISAGRHRCVWPITRYRAWKPVCFDCGRIFH
uniref:Integrase zinc-binding domain-containing protein n=1 Tax=Lygus hesperus TaxID=30085 RepID=A0A146LW12_LYGHE